MDPTRIVTSIILIACILVAITVALHAAGLVGLLRYILRMRLRLPTHFWPLTWLLIRLTWALLLIHVTEIAVWAFFFLWADACPMSSRHFIFPESPTRRLDTVTWYCRSRGECSGRLRG